MLVLHFITNLFSPLCVLLVQLIFNSLHQVQQNKKLTLLSIFDFHFVTLILKIATNFCFLNIASKM